MIACGLDFIYVYVCSRSFESQKVICLLLTYLFNIFISFYSLIYYSFFKGFHLLGKCNRRITDTCLTSLVSGFFCWPYSITNFAVMSPCFEITICNIFRNWLKSDSHSPKRLILFGSTKTVCFKWWKMLFRSKNIQIFVLTFLVI